MVVTYRDLKDHSEGITPTFIKSTFHQDDLDSILLGVELSKLSVLARDLVRDLDHTNDLTFVRFSCRQYEYMIAPDKDYFLVVVQEPGEDIPPPK